MEFFPSITKVIGLHTLDGVWRQALSIDKDHIICVECLSEDHEADGSVLEGKGKGLEDEK